MKLIRLKMYINSFCSISSSGILNPTSHSEALEILNGPKVPCVEPNYKDLIPPMQLRRMSKPVRTGVAAAKLCMQSYNDFMPQSIHVGTAYGMLEDSENFLKKLMDQEEQMLNPTAFIQSTHNTVSGQIALSIGCTAHNMTYVHSGHSFESALLDASLLLQDLDNEENILVGAVEEYTETSFEILKRFKVYTTQNIAGEGATFFCISKTKQEKSIAKVKTFEIFKAKEEDTLSSTLNRLMETHHASTDDVFIHGLDIDAPVFQNAKPYQKYSGKYATMSTWGLAYGCLMIQEKQSENCWILNGFGDYYSLIILSKP